MDILILIKKKNNNPMRCCCCVLWAQREGRPAAGWGWELGVTKRRPGDTRCGVPGVGPAARARASRAAAPRPPARPGAGPAGIGRRVGGRGWVGAPPGGSCPGGKCRGPPGSPGALPASGGSRHRAPSTTVPRASQLKPAGQVGRLRLSGKPATLGWRQFGGLPPAVRLARASCSLGFASGGAWCRPRTESAVPCCIFGRCTRALPVLFPHADPSAPGVSPACHSGQVPGADRGPVTGHPRRCPQSGCAT